MWDIIAQYLEFGLIRNDHDDDDVDGDDDDDDDDDGGVGEV